MRKVKNIVSILVICICFALSGCSEQHEWIHETVKFDYSSGSPYSFSMKITSSKSGLYGSEMPLSVIVVDIEVKNDIPDYLIDTYIGLGSFQIYFEHHTTIFNIEFDSDNKDDLNYDYYLNKNIGLYVRPQKNQNVTLRIFYNNSYNDNLSTLIVKYEDRPYEYKRL